MDKAVKGKEGDKRVGQLYKTYCKEFSSIQEQHGLTNCLK